MKKNGDENNIRIPDKKSKEMYAIAKKLAGGARIEVICDDKEMRLARIPGKMKQKARVRTGDLLIIKPWDIQDDKADIIYRYSYTQSKILKMRKLLPKHIDDF